ncbi:MAG TPA: hydantoinase/oxoprolinase N-terminal domain-containing protein, partial [Candidatus Binatia bacterium]|nr:hydantoinase/oxoprolinase N-terminal domain-containing protein [Candidatus Binatia bacterium]
MKRIGVDIGGTFTDILCLDEETGSVNVLKVPSTPENVADAMQAGLEEITRTLSINPHDIRFISHGCTVGTNAVIERKGVKVGLITTKGFRDVLELGRVARPADLLYDIAYSRATVLVPRHLRREITERVDYRGEVLKGLDEEEVTVVARDLVKQGVEAVAICLLFSFAYPEHERRVRQIINQLYPGLFVSISSALSPIYGEYERTS